MTSLWLRFGRGIRTQEMTDMFSGFGKVPDAGGDPPFKPVEAKLGPFVGNCW